jgi:uncharacterized UPF0160 family protein
MDMFGPKKVKIVTHNGKFHADDVCAVAVLDILHDGKIRVMRSRDPKVIASGDIVLDVGGKNDGVRFFDHHQPGGGGMRDNGVLYAAFGLIWKRFGVEVCRHIIGGENTESVAYTDIVAEADIVAKKFDNVFVQPIDAEDNGVNIFKETIPGVLPVTMGFAIAVMNPTWQESEDLENERFFESVKIYKRIISRFITMNAHETAAEAIVDRAYKEADDKRIIVLDKQYPYQRALQKYPEPLFVIYPKHIEHKWHVQAMKKEIGSFESRTYFPAAWAGKMRGELATVSGVEDAIFCHNKLFLAVAESKEGALALAKKALV